MLLIIKPEAFLLSLEWFLCFRLLTYSGERTKLSDWNSSCEPNDHNLLCSLLSYQIYFHSARDNAIFFNFCIAVSMFNFLCPLSTYHLMKISIKQLIQAAVFFHGIIEGNNFVSKTNQSHPRFCPIDTVKLL